MAAIEVPRMIDAALNGIHKGVVVGRIDFSFDDDLITSHGLEDRTDSLWDTA